jgi:hypothetical protein
VGVVYPATQVERTLEYYQARLLAGGATMEHPATKPAAPVPSALCSEYAPWMETAWSQEGIKLNPPDSFASMLRASLQLAVKLDSIKPLELPTLGGSRPSRLTLTDRKSTAMPRLTTSED